MSEKCPKCGAAYQRRGLVKSYWNCDSHVSMDGKFIDGYSCLVAQLAAANAEIERLRADAARFRYLKNNHARYSNGLGWYVNSHYIGTCEAFRVGWSLEEAIDSMLALLPPAAEPTTTEGTA